MKKSIIGGLVVLFLSSFHVFAQDINSAVNANNQFAFKLYSTYKSKDGNIFFSPYSISSALAMTYEGAKGKTADEMQSIFNFSKDDSLRRGSFLEIKNIINQKDKKYKLSTANALWAQSGYEFLNDYFKLINQYYGGKVTNLDFINKTEESRMTINHWVEGQTNDKIKNLIPYTRLVLTNAIYFKGKWAKEFDKNLTTEKDFRVSLNNTVKAQMMSENDDFNYTETESLQVLELPYQDNELSMIILLPKKDDLSVVEGALTLEKLSGYKNALEIQKVDVSIPRFKFETKYFMKEDLIKMGMLTAFSGDADFSGMTGKHDLFIGQVIHQAFVDVNEEGTEAAAATAVIMEAGSAMPQQPKVFNADHPFLFLIQEKKTGNILFMGRVSNPIK